MSISKARARKLAKRILRDNKKGRSYRVIAREDYPMVGADGRPIIKPGTLNRFANGKGTYIPVEEDILIALGLKKPRNPMSILPKWFYRTEEALLWFKEKRATVKQMNSDTRELLAKGKKSQ